MPHLLDIAIKHKHYAGKAVLQQLHFQLAEGEIVSLLGPSGCGKSTLLRIIAGLESDFDGALQLDGQRYRGIHPAIGVVFQEPRLLPWLSVAENIGFDLGRAGRDDPRVDALLAEVGLLGLRDALPKQLSGGQAQRVAIARALFRQPRLLLLDEPFSAVDAFTRMRLQDLLLAVAAKHGTTVLLVTHDPDEALYLSERVLVLGGGQIALSQQVALPRPRERHAPVLNQLKLAALDALYAAHAI
ncbi:ABC transporter ATP-binding protein [Chitinimonas taiwanensis]|uniref:ABC transporter ATP-binding protein n=1 Tax=Chitinimonas taiwanensis TaxID=240412 RepID=UPI0035B229B7